jgi:integral membrane protein
VNVRNFRTIALVEATTFLLLLVGSVLKRTSDLGVLVTILGPIHGILFIAYVVFALNLRSPEGWTNRETAGILLGAVLPFGGYFVDAWLKRREPVTA